MIESTKKKATNKIANKINISHNFSGHRRKRKTKQENISVNEPKMLQKIVIIYVCISVTKVYIFCDEKPVISRKD